jgi:hypothetical protein
MLSGLAHFLKDLCRSLGGLPHITEQQDEEFFWILYGHSISPFRGVLGDATVATHDSISAVSDALNFNPQKQARSQTGITLQLFQNVVRAQWRWTKMFNRKSSRVR